MREGYQKFGYDGLRDGRSGKQCPHRVLMDTASLLPSRIHQKSSLRGRARIHFARAPGEGVIYRILKRLRGSNANWGIIAVDNDAEEVASREPMKAQFYEGELRKNELENLLMPMIEKYDVVLVDDPGGLIGFN
jgi:cellulose biosynthesis protein BcsQ